MIVKRPEKAVNFYDVSVEPPTYHFKYRPGARVTVDCPTLPDVHEKSGTVREAHTTPRSPSHPKGGEFYVVQLDGYIAHGFYVEELTKEQASEK